MRLMIYEFRCSSPTCGRTYEAEIMGPIGKGSGAACQFCRGQAYKTDKRGRSAVRGALRVVAR